MIITLVHYINTMIMLTAHYEAIKEGLKMRG